MNSVNFWDNTHPLAAKSEELFEELVPAVGSASTLQGELLRASSKIGYDWYNNGWGCNNWSGAVVFLQQYTANLPVAVEDSNLHEFYSALREVHGYSHGERANISDERADMLVTRIHEYVVKAILANPTPVDNDIDMLDLGEDDAPYEEEDEDDYYYEDEDEDDE